MSTQTMTDCASRDTLCSLKAAVQYRRKDGGHDWITMAAFDVRGVADHYASDFCNNPHWDYRVVDLTPADGECAPAAPACPLCKLPSGHLVGCPNAGPE